MGQVQPLTNTKLVPIVSAAPIALFLATLQFFKPHAVGVLNFRREKHNAFLPASILQHAKTGSEPIWVWSDETEGTGGICVVACTWDPKVPTTEHPFLIGRRPYSNQCTIQHNFGELQVQQRDRC